MRCITLLSALLLTLWPSQAQDLRGWQAVLLKEKGIAFKLPAAWQHDDSDAETRHEFYVIESMEWDAPGKKEFIRIFIHTYPQGFLSDSRRPATAAEMVAEEFNHLTRTQESGPSYSEVKKVRAGKVEGVFSKLTLDFKDKEIGLREGIFWTGYRIYQGRQQKIEINASAHPKDDATLRAIFATLEVEQDETAQGAPEPL